MTEQIQLLDVDPYARHEDDFYATPFWMTRALLRRLPSLTQVTGRLVEPCVGDGAILRELYGWHTTADVLTNDIVKRGAILPEFLLDATRRATWQAFARTGRLDVVVSNFPFDVSFGIVTQAYEAAQVGLALLLRLSWLEPVNDPPRGAWLQLHPPTRLIVLPRHDWRGNGSTDSVTSAWMLWAKEPWFCAPGLEVVTTNERDELIASAARERL